MEKYVYKVIFVRGIVYCYYVNQGDKKVDDQIVMFDIFFIDLIFFGVFKLICCFSL